MLKKKSKRIMSILLVMVITLTTALSNAELSGAYDGGYEPNAVSQAGEASDVILEETADIPEETLSETQPLETENGAGESGHAENNSDMTENSAPGGDAEGVIEDFEIADEAAGTALDSSNMEAAAGAANETLKFEYRDADLAVTAELKKWELEKALYELAAEAGTGEDGFAGAADGEADIPGIDQVSLSVTPITEEDAGYGPFLRAVHDRAGDWFSDDERGRIQAGEDAVHAELYEICFYTWDHRKLRLNDCGARVSFRMSRSGIKEDSEFQVVHFARLEGEELDGADPEQEKLIELAEGVYRPEKIDQIDYSLINGELGSIAFDAPGFSPYGLFWLEKSEEIIETETETEEWTEPETETEGWTEPETETEGWTESETETETEGWTESETEAGTEPETEAESESEMQETETEEQQMLAAQDSGQESETKQTKIEKIEVSFDPGSNRTVTEEGTGKVIEVWKAENKNSGHRFTFSVTYSVSGTVDLEPKEFRILIPKSILKNTSGASADYYEMSLPHEREADDTTEFVYREETIEGKEYIVVYNYAQVPVAQNGYFQVSYFTGEETFEYRDYEYKDENGHYTSSEPFQAAIKVRDAKDRSKDLYVGIDTQARINYTTKRTPTYYEAWDPSWGTEPGREEGRTYFYLLWGIQTSISTNTTQKYKFQLKDELPESVSGELVKYKLQGENAYSSFEEDSDSTGVLENQTLTGTRYDYVVTRHDKAVYDELLKKDGKYTIPNTVSASVISEDDGQETTASGAGSYSKVKPEPPVFHPHVGTGSISKSGGVRKYELSVLKSGTDSSGNVADRVEGLTYTVRSVGNPYQWTLRNGGKTDEPEDYGQKKVHYELTDHEIYYGDYQLTADDYEIAGLSFSYTIKDAVYNDVKKSFDPVDTVTYDEDEVFQIEAEKNGNWYKIGTYCPDPASGTPFTEGTGSGECVENFDADTRTFTFRSGVTGYRITTDNKHYLTQIIAQPSVTVKCSEGLKNKIPKDAAEAAFKNKANLILSEVQADPDAEKYVNRDAYGTDTLLEVERTSRMTKSVVSSANHVKEKYYSITWKVAMWEKIKNAQGEAYVNQNSGVFYDLLPEGSALDASSILVENDAGYLDSSAYEVEVRQNYKNSARTLLVVRIKEPGDYYNLLFDTIQTWESLKDYGVHVMNPAAYETGNEDIKNGHPDDGGDTELQSNNLHGVLVDNKALFVDLDPETEGKKFLYAQTPHHIDAITSATTGLDKKVMGTEDTDYSYNTVVKPGGIYSYKLRYANSLNSSSRNNIIYDCLEQFAPGGNTSEWRGRILSVDVSQLREKGAEPVVYYSKTVEEENLEGITAEEMSNGDGTICYPGVLDVENTANWKKASLDPDNHDLFLLPENQNITAIAIDIRKKEDDTAFVLPEGGSVFVIIHMQAPPSDQQPFDGENETPYVHYPLTYNNVYIATTIVSSADAQKNSFIEQDYTTVKYHVVGDVYLTKVNTEDPEEKIGGVTFRLYGTSDYGKPVDLFETTDRYGNLVFKDVERGSYKLMEYSEDPDWLPDHHERDVRIDASGRVTVTYGAASPAGDSPEDTEGTGTDGGSETDPTKYNTDENPYLFGNKERIHTDVEFTKYELGADGELVKGAKFKLTGISGYGNDITMYAVSGGSGKVIFENLEYGSYIMTEVEAAAGYGRMNAAFQVTVDETGQYHIQLDSASAEKYRDYFEDENGYKIYNEKLSEFVIQKQDSWTHEPLNGAVFRLYGISDNGTDVDLIVETANIDGAGTARFYGLEAGSYILQETKAPIVTDEEGNEKKYILDETKRIVTVGKDGKITIDGTAYREGVPHVINNTPVKGSLKVVKIWLDEYGDDNTERSENSLDIRLSTTEPGYTASTAEFVSYKGSFSGTSLFGKEVFNDYSVSKIQSFSRCPYSATEKEVIEKGAEIISAKDSVPVYGWVEEAEQEVVENGEVQKVKKTCFYWWSEAASVKFAPGTMYMFEKLANLETVDLNGTDTSQVKSFQYAFYGCTSLTRVTGPLYTSEADNMGAMFYNCTSLTEIESLKYFDTSKVTTFFADSKMMFEGCSSIQSLNLSSFDLSGGKVKRLANMFSGCTALESINFGSHFNAVNVTEMQNMFQNCRSLTSVDTSSFHADKITNLNSMFSGCSSLVSVNCSGLGTSGGTGCTAQSMFKDCTALGSVNMASFDTSKITNMQQMFDRCTSLVTLDLSHFDTSNVTTMRNMLSNCGLLETVVFGNGFDTSKVTDMFGMFYLDKRLNHLDVSQFNTAQVTDMQYMFSGCSALTEIDVSSFNTASVTTVHKMFQNCGSLITIWAKNDEACFGNVSRGYNAAGAKITTEEMFSNCSSLIGGCGTTTQMPGATTGEYARIDVNAEGKYGLFTDVSQKNASGSETNASAALISYSERNLVVLSADTEGTGYTDAVILPANAEAEEVSEGAAGEGAGNEEAAGEEAAGEDAAGEETAGGENGIEEDGDGQPDSAAAARVELSTRVDQDSYTLEKDGNVWTYTFQVNDAVWYAWEDIVPVGYEILEVNGVPAGDKAHPLKVREGETVTITNKRKDQEYVPPKYGSLVLNKKVFQTAENAAEEQIFNSGTRYEFTVTLTDEKGSPLTGTAIYGDTVFTGGVATVYLTSGGSAEGDTAVFTNIPSGYHYSITEKPADGVNSSCTTANASGVISDSAQASVSFKNVINPRPTQDFFIEKKVSGAEGQDTEYGMDVALTGLEKNTKYHIRKAVISSDSAGGEGTAGQPEYQSYMWFLTDASGNADVAIGLKSNERVKFEAVPVGSTYQVTEEAGEAYRASFEVKDGRAGAEGHTGSIVQAGKSNTNTNTALTTAVETVDAGEEVTVTFLNEIVKTQELKVVKAIDTPLGYDPDLSFDFLAQFSGLGDGYSFASGAGKITADQSGCAEKTFSLKPGEEMVFRKLPVGAEYRITELDAGKYISSYVIVNSAGGEKIAQDQKADSSDRLASALQSEGSSPTEAQLQEARKLSTDKRPVEVNADPVVTFTNILPTADLSVSKQVAGSLGDKTKKFTFTVSDFKYEDQDLQGVYPLEKKYADGTVLAVGNVSFDGGGNASFAFTADGESAPADGDFSLGHNEVLTIKGLPIGTAFTITEKRDGIAEYTVSNTVTEHGSEPVVRTDSPSGQDGNVASGTVVKGNTEAAFTNEKEGVVPTGIPNSNLLLLLLLGLGAASAAALLLKRSRRRLPG